jgi:NAD(P)H-dependent flavin oxidoreductase YrpB (nitropropane dioxygenase family)
MNLPVLNIGDLKANIPVVLGGMGIGVSRNKLASAVANEGGIGVMSGVHIGYDQPDFYNNTFKANLRAIKEQIALAREKSPNGIIGMNFMTAMNRYGEYVKAAVEEGIDIIVSGAGLPLELPAFAENSKTKLLPIVSSGRALKLILKKWDTKYKRTADAIVIEGINAGGHLGFKEEEILNNTFSFKETIKEIKEMLEKFEDKYGMKIPIIAAGGIYDRMDAEAAIVNGADGVQMSTRFIATEECDAAEEYKKIFINMKKEDIKIIKSPVGLPARAYNNKLIKDIDNGIKKYPEKCTSCLKECYLGKNMYCISDVLIKAVKGDVENGLIFTGSNGYKIDKIDTVKNIFNEFRN